MDGTSPKISGYDASFIIKTKIKQEKFENCIIIGNSADSSIKHNKRCKDSMMNLVFNRP